MMTGCAAPVSTKTQLKNLREIAGFGAICAALNASDGDVHETIRVLAGMAMQEINNPSPAPSYEPCLDNFGETHFTNDAPGCYGLEAPM